MAPDDGREPDGDDDPTRRHLEAALDTATDDSVRYHVRQALQHHLIGSENQATRDADSDADADD